MRVKDILRQKGDHVVHVKTSESLINAIQLMEREHIGAVAVLDNHGKLEGMLSEREVVRALAREMDRVLVMRCADVMLETPPTCSPATTTSELARTMTQARVRHVPVMGENGVMGIVSIGDITKAQLGEKELENGVLHDMLLGSRRAYA